MRRLSLLVAAVVGLLLVAPATASAAPSYPSSMAAAGDSITRGFDATFFPCLLSDCPQYSWATGTSTSVNSYAQRIRTASGHAVTTANVAKTGAKMSDLAGQLAAVPPGTQYVTVLMGANDVCTSSSTNMTPTATFTQQFSDALTAFHTANSAAVVFVSSIPNIYQLWATLHTNRSAASAWKTFGICQSMLAASNTDAVRQTVQKQEIADNNALASICGALSYCRYDNNAVYNYSFVASQVSTVDYFHPSIAGQAKLASLTWGATTWG